MKVKKEIYLPLILGFVYEGDGNTPQILGCACTTFGI